VSVPSSDLNRTASDTAYHELKSWILHGEVPLGVRLGEGRLAARLSMSRTPVREALLRLHAERFVERHPDGGFRIRHPRAQAMLELYDVRKALELFALQRTVADHTACEERLRFLRGDWAAMEPDAPEADPDFVLLDEEFHTELVAMTGNSELQASLRWVTERIRPIRTHDFLMAGRIATTIEQHTTILDATLAGDPVAVQLLDAHICESQRYVEAAVSRAVDRMLSTTEEDLEW
jgi:DNA-binding GntR family transcriptional regulator